MNRQKAGRLEIAPPPNEWRGCRRQLKAVIWDLDGTLVDSLETHIYAWQATMAENQFTMTREHFEAVNGKTMVDALRQLLGDAPSASELAEIERRKEARFRERLHAVGLQPMPGVLDWLDRLTRAGWRHAIATSGPRANVNAMLAAVNLAEVFTGVVSAEDVQRGKPDPEAYVRAASLLDVAPARCIAVDDAAPGLKGAHLAGMRTIGVGPNYRTLKADMTVAVLSELPEQAFEKLLVA